MKILLTDCATVRFKGDISLDILKNFGDVTEYELISREELLDIIPDYDAVICNKTVIDKPIMEKAKKLKYIGLFATGYNNIDISTAAEKGITVCNAGSYSTNAVAQQVFAYILSHYTKVSVYDNFVKKGGWKQSAVFSPIVFPTDEIYGKTIGIVGYGSIGKAVEKAAEAFGMRVLVYTRTKRPGKKFVSFDELLSGSDIITMHCPLNKESEKLMNKESFAKCKDGAFFINTSRGGVVDEKALFDALETEKLSGAAIDVLETEPMLESCVLINAKNITITPHTAWAPLTTRERLIGIVADNLKGYIEGNIQNKIV